MYAISRTRYGSQVRRLHTVHRCHRVVAAGHSRSERLHQRNARHQQLRDREACVRRKRKGAARLSRAAHQTRLRGANANPACDVPSFPWRCSILTTHPDISPFAFSVSSTTNCPSLKTCASSRFRHFRLRREATRTASSSRARNS